MAVYKDGDTGKWRAVFRFTDWMEEIEAKDGSRNVNDYFYESEGKQIEKMNTVIGDIELTQGEEQTFLWLAGWKESTVNHILSVIEKTARKRANKMGGNA